MHLNLSEPTDVHVLQMKFKNIRKLDDMLVHAVCCSVTIHRDLIKY